MTPATPETTAPRGWIARSLDLVERVGNKLPDPVTLFIISIMLLMVVVSYSRLLKIEVSDASVRDDALPGVYYSSVIRGAWVDSYLQIQEMLGLKEAQGFSARAPPPSRAMATTRITALATRMAEQSRAEAELAMARSQMTKALIVNQEMRDSTESLKQEMQRNTGVRP